MMRLDIAVPDLNDSYSRVVLDNVQYLIRFTWNETARRWYFGLYTTQREPIAVGMRLVPRFPINLQVVHEEFPQGIFGVYTDLENIGRKDFVSGKAVFVYVSVGQGAQV